MKSEETERYSRQTCWSASCWLVLGLATGSPGQEPRYFVGQPVKAIIASGRDTTWAWKPQPIVAGVIRVGAVREIFNGFVDASIEPGQQGVGASATKKGFTLKASPEAEGKKFKGEVKYQIQQQVFMGPGKWQNMGGLQTRATELIVHVAQSAPPKIVVAAKLSNDLKMAGDARAIDIKPSTSVIADVEIKDPRQPIVVGKRPGKEEFKLKYQIEDQRLELPLVVEVVHREISVAHTIGEGDSQVIPAARLQVGTGLTDWKLQEVLGVKHPAIAAAKKEKETLLLTGRDAGSTRVSAIYSARDAQSKSERPLKIKVKLEVEVKPMEQVEIPSR